MKFAVMRRLMSGAGDLSLRLDSGLYPGACTELCILIYPVSRIRLTVSRIQYMNGEGCANLLETGVLSCNAFYAAAWKRDVIDYTELASKRWVEKLSMDRIAAEMGWGRTAVIRHLGKIRANPGLVEDGQVRLRIHRRRYRFMGNAGR